MIQSVERVFAIIHMLSENAEPQALGAISASCQLAPATTHRFLDTLCQLGYVKGDSSGHYALTPKLFSMTGNAIKQTSLVSIAQEHLITLSNRSHETVHLLLRDGYDMLYVFKAVQSIGSIQMSSHIGMRIPMYRTSAGKAILSMLPEAEALQIFRSSDIQQVTPYTITNEAELLRQLEEIRRVGYAIDREENELGIVCYGMPLGIEKGNTRYAFSVSSLKSRFNSEHAKEVVSAMRETKKRIEDNLASF